MQTKTARREAPRRFCATSFFVIKSAKESAEVEKMADM